MDKHGADLGSFAGRLSLTVPELCRRLDGLPLALELAAARTKLFPPQTLLARLDDSLAMLSNPLLDTSGRRHTLRTTIDWGYAVDQLLAMNALNLSYPLNQFFREQVAALHRRWDPALAAAWEKGCRLSPDELLAYARADG